MYIFTEFVRFLFYEVNMSKYVFCYLVSEHSVSKKKEKKLGVVERSNFLKLVLMMKNDVYRSKLLKKKKKHFKSHNKQVTEKKEKLFDTKYC